MQSKIRLQFANDLLSIYGNPQPPAIPQQVPTLTQQEIDKYAQTSKEQTEKYNERKKRREQKFQKLTREQITQIVKIIKQDKQFSSKFSSAILQHTEIAQLIKKAHSLKIMKSINTQLMEFKKNMTMKVQELFVIHQNKLTDKLRKLLADKQIMMLSIFEQKLLQNKHFKCQQILVQQLQKALEIELHENCKKHTRALSQQFVTMYEGIAQIIGQHAELNRDSKFEQEFYQQINKVKEFFNNVEQQYIKKLQTDISEYYLNAITLILQAQSKLKLT